MVDTDTIFESLAPQVEPKTLAAIRELIDRGGDAALSRINPLRFAGEHSLGEADAIGSFVRATHAGLFDLSWSVLCPGCAGTLLSGHALQDITESHYNCALCRRDSAPVLDENVEVTFTVSPRVKKIAAHTPGALSFWDYAQQINWSSGIELPSDVSEVMGGAVLDTAVLPGQESTDRQLELAEGTIVVFDLVSHTAQFMNMRGARSETRQSVSVELSERHPTRQPIELQPGPINIHIRNTTAERALPALLRVDESLLKLVSRRVPFLTAKRLLTDQAFRDLYRTGVLHIDQRFKITSLTFLFTDLKGSTELYERVGDLSAYDLVQMHFRALEHIVAGWSGAIVKTIGDSVMATFATPKDGLNAALHMRDAMARLNKQNHRDDIVLKIGLHAGPCLAVSLNERQDYFGQTVNMASRLQNMARPRSILTTAAVLDDAGGKAAVQQAGFMIEVHQSALRGIQNSVETYEIY